MKPVLIFRHVECEGPAYLADFLDARHIPWKVVKVDKGDPVPDSPDQSSGLVFMGGPMSVNDDLPWVKQELELIRAAHAKKIPLLGHCLGGQLISKALGGSVTRNPVQEIGWFPLTPIISDEALLWTADLPFNTEIFHWHGETFSLPDGAIPLFRSKHCVNQGFAMGNTLALQCHVEIKQEDIIEWCREYDAGNMVATETVQNTAMMLQNVETRTRQLHEFADKLYTQWVSGLENKRK